MVWWWWILPAVVGLLAATIVLKGLGALFRGRLFSALLGVGFGGVLLMGALAAALAGLDVQTYQRLTYERPVARIEIDQKGPRLYDLTLTPEAGIPRTYEMQGDEWRVEARVLKWKPWANVLGLDSQYRLDRLSGRYADVPSELSAPRSAYDLKPPESPVDLWQIARADERISFVDTLYGSGASMPMSDDGEYEVWITQDGLIARPANAQARRAMTGGWR